MMPFPPVDTAHLRIKESVAYSNVRRDLHTFVEYCQDNHIKRSHRENALPKTDLNRLMKMIPAPSGAPESEDDSKAGHVAWIDFVDDLAHGLGFVKYDIKGTYAGYSSHSPSFPDNYIQFDHEAYRKYLISSLYQQERTLLGYLEKDFSYSSNEFFHAGILGELDGFEQWGCATGVVPHLDFQKIRRFLLDLLASCPVGIWLGTESLIALLKQKHPFFLIPQKVPKDYPGEVPQRYQNFREISVKSKSYERGTPVPDSALDAFERVEGRYVERFLEGIVFLLGYVDVAYETRVKPATRPSIGLLKAFRVRDRLIHVVKGTVPEPRVWVQSNFEVYVESDLYPAQVLAQLRPLADIIKEDQVTILRLKKEYIAAALAQNATLDVHALLSGLTKGKLPANVVTELAAWGKHAEMFTLFEDFSLLETTSDCSKLGSFIREPIGPHLAIVHSPDKLFHQLESLELIPQEISHHAAGLTPADAHMQTLFPKAETMAKKAAALPKVTIPRRTTMTYGFPHEGIFDRVGLLLAKAQCLFHSDKAKRTITVSAAANPLLLSVLKSLKGELTVRIEDVE